MAGWNMNCPKIFQEKFGKVNIEVRNKNGIFCDLMEIIAKLMLKQKIPEDFVISTGQQISVKMFAKI